MLLRLLWPWFYNTPVPAQSALMRGNNNPQQKWPQFVYYDQMLGFFFKMAIEIIKILYRGKKKSSHQENNGPTTTYCRYNLGLNLLWDRLNLALSLAGTKDGKNH